LTDTDICCPRTRPAAAGSWLGTVAYPAMPEAQSFAQRILPAADKIEASNASHYLSVVALAHRIRASRRPSTNAVLAGTGLVLAIPSAAGFVASLLSYLTSGQPTPTGGALLHEQGFAFGPTTETLLSLHLPDLSFDGQQVAAGLQQLWIWGFALVAVAAVLARRSNNGEKLDVRAA
jgi:hypothetical protein